jgi:hypothetical protein
MKNIIPLKEVYELVKDVKSDICNEYRAFDDDEIPGIQLTIGANESGEWSFQTGDNSYSGDAYHYPHWGVVGVYRNSNCMELAKELIEQIEDLIVF